MDLEEITKDELIKRVIETLLHIETMRNYPHNNYIQHKDYQKLENILLGKATEGTVVPWRLLEEMEGYNVKDLVEKRGWEKFYARTYFKDIKIGNEIIKKVTKINYLILKKEKNEWFRKIIKKHENMK